MPRQWALASLPHHLNQEQISQVLTVCRQAQNMILVQIGLYCTNQLVYLGVAMAPPQSQERILAQAKELFLARGYAATTADKICEKTELTKGSFYIYEEDFDN
jgi:Bacterial regulatory proteins, tetR family